MRLMMRLAIGLLLAAPMGCSSSDTENEPTQDASTSVDAGVDAQQDATPEASDDAVAEAQPDAPEEAAADVVAEASGPRLLATIETNMGAIVVELNPTAAPITVENFQNYADDQYFDGLLFHRVIKGFMIQGGGLEPGMTPRATTYPPIVNEAPTSGLSNLRGTISMARTSDPDSATSQFFINTEDNEFLNPGNGQAGYAVFGQVVDGMDVVDEIESVSTDSVGSYDDVPVKDVLIVSIVVNQE
jgi:cyclophilin family peptidyl-prolyl cis-trans isomerase